MNKEELAADLTDTYGVTGEYLFTRYPNYQVFRYTGNQKWFASSWRSPERIWA